MSQIKTTKKKKEKPKMDPDHLFQFNCDPGVSCFTQCCQDVTIVLTPYDVLRLKKGLGISSDKFLDEYYQLRGWTEAGIPNREKLEELGLGYVVGDMEPFLGKTK